MQRVDRASYPVRAALVGAGWWGRRLAAAAKVIGDRLQLCAVADPDENAARPYAKQEGLAYVRTLDEVLADPDVEAVLLATPHGLHVEQVLAAASAGRHVWCEKPLAITASASRTAIEACRARGVQLAVGTDKRALPAMQRLLKLASQGTLGELLLVEAQYANNFARGLAGAAWRRDPTQAPAGGLTGPGLHALDAVVALGGPVRRVETRVHAPNPTEAADAVVTVLGHRSGVTGLASAVRGAPEHYRVQVCGTEGRAVMNGFNRLRVDINGRAPDERAYADDLALPAMLRSFAESIRGGEAFPISLESVHATSIALEGAIASARTDRPVRWHEEARQWR